MRQIYAWRGFCMFRKNADNNLLNQDFALILSFVVGLAMLLILTSPVAVASQIAKGDTVTIVSFSFPPRLHTTASGEFSGTVGETVKMLCEAAKLDCNFRVVPLKRGYQQIQTGDADAIITINLGQLTDCCIPSDWASPWTSGFFSSSDARVVPKTQEELNGQSLIIVTGMKSPYLFAKDLEQMEKDQSVTLLKAPKILSAVKMFLENRSPLVWGGEELKWYIDKLNKGAKYAFKPLLERPIVLWVRKDKPEILASFNKAYETLFQAKSFNQKNLLVPSLMKQRYVDAPFKE